MIAAALAALKGLGVVRWIWDHRAWLKWLAAGLVIAALTGLWRWERHDRVAAEAVATAAGTARDLALEDVARWRNASDLRDAAIGRLDDLIARQNAAVLKLQFSLDAANQAAARAEAVGRDARTQFDRRVKEIDDEAKAHPEDVVPLGRIVRGRVDRLWD
jgi:hypothetical protein